MPANPSSPIQIGQTGVLGGATYRVAGRIEMSMEEGGQIYYWTEYYLVGEGTARATLVEESAGNGTEWRLFRLLDPGPAIAATDAARYRVGDRFQMEGVALRVSRVDRSRVHQIEGEAPEGVEVGDVAEYFNAESGNQMVVVSWTGSEVEVFRGVQLPTYAVQKAFNFQAGRVASKRPGLNPIANAATNPNPYAAQEAEDEKSGWKGVAIAALVVVGVVALVGWKMSQSDFLGSPAKPQAPKAALRVGQSGDINGGRCRITGRATVQIGRVNLWIARQEYLAVDDSGHEFGLVQENEGWTRMDPIAIPGGLTPQTAGGRKLGSQLAADMSNLLVADLFLSVAGPVDGNLPLLPRTPLYGLEARGAGRNLLVRWNSDTVWAYELTRLPRNVGDAFGATK